MAHCQQRLEAVVRRISIDFFSIPCFIHSRPRKVACSFELFVARLTGFFVYLRRAIPVFSVRTAKISVPQSDIFVRWRLNFAAQSDIFLRSTDFLAAESLEIARWTVKVCSTTYKDTSKTEMSVMKCLFCKIIVNKFLRNL